MNLDPVKKNNVVILNPDINNKTIVFAHGFGTDQTAWETVASAFREDHRIILYDNVGAGKSAPEMFSPNKYDTLYSYADDLIDICEATKVKDGVIVAHSVSAMISILATIKAPQYFSKLILVGASPRYLNDSDYNGGFDQDSLNNLYQAMSNNYFAWVSGFAAAVMENADRPHLAESFARSLSTIRPDIAQSVARVIFQSDHRDALPKLDKPTLLLQTKHDLAVPMDVAQYLNEHLKNSILQVVDAQGHFPHISAAEEIIAEIQNFL